ncbi:MAG TPA: hypothetical protein VFV99_11875 [Kofleriaceae bacterium]|nr:hypothetical protein [Kofleriaceae bacterium]
MVRAIVDELLRRPWLALVLALLVQIVVFVFGQSDLPVADPLWYANIAHKIAVDPSTVFDHAEIHPFVMRVGLTMPVAVLYKLFGVSTLTTNLYALWAALGVIIIVYAAAPSPRAKLLGMVLATFCVALLRNANVLNVDLPAATWMGAAVLCLSRRDRPRGTWWIVGAAVATIAAFLVKETAVWLAVVWLYTLAVDVRSDARAALRRFAPGLVVGAVLTAAYLWVCARVWGSPFARFSGIEELTYEHTWSLQGKPASAWVNRLTWQAPWFLLAQFQLLLPIALASPWLVRGRLRIWVVAAAAFVLLFWFGSSSLSAYTPLPLVPRMVMPILPVLLVVATLTADAAIDRVRDASWRIALAIVLALALVIPTGRAMLKLVLRQHPETDAFAIVRHTAATGNSTIVVCAEERCGAAGNFHFGFEIPANVSFNSVTEYASQYRNDAHVFVLVNLHRIGPQSEHVKLIEALHLPSLTGHRYVKLYDAGDGAALRLALQSTLHWDP